MSKASPANPVPPEQTRPYGSEPGRRRWPLWTLAILFGLWVVFIAVLAIAFPGR